jgi:ribosomal protein S18 acetylase RimI-like enzyme
MSASDEDALFAAWARVVEEGGAFPRAPPARRDEFRGAWIEGKHAVMVARLDGRLAGSYFLAPAYPGLGAHVATAGYLVEAELRGRGLGTTLLEHSIEEARRLGFDALLLRMVLESNPSRRLYERAGFERVGRVPDVVDGQAVLSYWRVL